MIFSSWLRYCTGYVSFEAYTAEPQRFFSLALEQGVKLFKTVKTQTGARGMVSVKGYKILARNAKKVSTRLRVVKKYGLPFILNRNRKRWGIYLGAVFFVAFLSVSQSFIWEIKLPQYDEKKSQMLLKSMEDYGIFVGAFKPNLNMKMIQNKVLIDSDDLSWVAFNVRGSKLYVELEQKNKMLPIESDVPCNIIARKTGQIVAIEPQHGQALVEQKAVVLAGEMLISGRALMPDGTERGIHAAGKVIAETLNFHSISFDFNQSEKSYGEIKNRYSLDLFGLNIPLYLAIPFESEYEIVSQKIPVNFFSQDMPYGIKKDEYHLFTTTQNTYDEASAATEIELAFLKYEQEEMADVKILETEQTQVNDGEKLTITRKYRCEENIAQQVIIHE